MGRWTLHTNKYSAERSSPHAVYPVTTRGRWSSVTFARPCSRSLPLRLVAAWPTYGAKISQENCKRLSLYGASIHLPYARHVEGLFGRQEGYRQHEPLVLPRCQDRHPGAERRR